MSNKQYILVGLFIGLTSNVLSSTIYTYFISNNSIFKTFEMAYNSGYLTSIISLGALPNLPMFFFLLHKNKETMARGILLATIVIAFVTLLVKILL